MNRCLRMILCFVLLYCCFAVSSVHADLASSGGMEQTYYRNTGKNFIASYSDDAGITAPDRINIRSYYGILAIKELNLDNDAEPELVVVTIDPSGKDAGNNLLNAQLYDYDKKENTIKRLASCTLSTHILSRDSVQCDVFLLKKGSKYYLCCEDKEQSNLIDKKNSYNWDLSVYQIKRKKWPMKKSSFAKKIDTQTSNNDLFSKTRCLVKKLKKIGCSVETLQTVSILEQVTENIEPLCSISRYRTVSQEDLMNYLNYGDGTIYIYGKTIFQNVCNPSLENKISSDFGVWTDGILSSDLANPAVILPDPVTNQSEKTETPTESSPPLTESLVSSAGSSDASNSLATSNTYVISFSNTAYVTYADLDQLTAEEIWIARNEIYARHGRSFHNMTLRDYFQSQCWYHETVSAEAFDLSYAKRVLNDYEIKNIDTIIAYEKEHGINQNK